MHDRHSEGGCFVAILIIVTSLALSKIIFGLEWMDDWFKTWLIAVIIAFLM